MHTVLFSFVLFKSAMPSDTIIFLHPYQTYQQGFIIVSFIGVGASYYLDQCWPIVHYTLRDIGQRDFNHRKHQTKCFEKVVCEMAASLFSSQCDKCHSHHTVFGTGATLPNGADGSHWQPCWTAYAGPRLHFFITLCHKGTLSDPPNDTVLLFLPNDVIIASYAGLIIKVNMDCCEY